MMYDDMNGRQQHPWMQPQQAPGGLPPQQTPPMQGPNWGAIGERLQQRFGGRMPQFGGGMPGGMPPQQGAGMQRPMMPWAGGMQGGGVPQQGAGGGWRDAIRGIASRFGGGGQGNEPGGGIVNPAQQRGIVPEGWGQGQRR